MTTESFSGNDARESGRGFNYQVQHYCKKKVTVQYCYTS